MSRTGSESVPLDALEVRAFRVPTDTPIETDGTFAWSATTMVLVQAAGGGARGIGCARGTQRRWARAELRVGVSR